MNKPIDTRHADQTWSLPTSETGQIKSWEAVQIAVLMDIRDQLKILNRLLHCPNFYSIPAVLNKIKNNTNKRKRKE